MSMNWDIKSQGLIAFHIPIKRSFMGWFDKGVNVVHGTWALLFENGAYRGAIPEGAHTRKSLGDTLGHKLGKADVEVVLVHAGDLIVEHGFDKVESSDHYPLDVSLQLRIRIHDPSAFFLHFVQPLGGRVQFDQLKAELLHRRVDSACRVAVKRFGVAQLREAHGGRDLRIALEAELERELRDELRRTGLEVVHLAWFKATNERLETLQDRRVDLVFRQEEHKQQIVERDFEKVVRDWEEGERRDDREFDHENWRWDSDKDLAEARDRLQAWSSMAQVVRNKKVLQQGDVLELKDELGRQSADYRKSGVLRDEDMRRFDREVDWKQIEDEWTDTDRKTDRAHEVELADRHRRLVLEKLEVQEWAELAKHRMLQEAEVEALQLRIQTEQSGAKADSSELQMKTEQRLNRVFLNGKAEELELQAAVAETARRASILAMRHELDAETLSLSVDVAKGEREASALTHALRQKAAAADFTRAEAISDAKTAAEVRQLALGIELEIARGEVDAKAYGERMTLALLDEGERSKIARKFEEEQNRVRIRRMEDKTDIETLGELQKIKERKLRLKAELAAEEASRAATSAAAEREHALAVAQNAGRQALDEKQLDVQTEAQRIEAETERLRIKATMDKDQLHALKDGTAQHAYDAEARTAEAKHSAEAERREKEAVLAERDRSAAQLDDRDARERADRAGHDDADRQERREQRSHDAQLVALAAGGRTAAEAQQQMAADAALQAERGFRGELREDMREGRSDLKDVAIGRSTPAPAPSAPAGPDVSVRVDVGMTSCSMCGTSIGQSAKFCEHCGAKRG